VTLARQSPTPGERDPALAVLLIGVLMLALGTALPSGDALGTSLVAVGAALGAVAVIWMTRLR
jgi:hypothetical protein